MAVNKDNIKVMTDNPLLDEIVWNAKQLIRDIVLKDQDEADRNESLESARNGDTYVAILKYGPRFERFAYTEDMLRKLPNINEQQIRDWTIDNTLIPDDLKKVLAKMASDEFVNNYVETNNYYRMLHGEPNYDPTGEWEGLWIDINTIDPRSGNPVVSDRYESTPGTDFRLIHTIDNSYIELLYENGSIDNILADEDMMSQYQLNKMDLLYLKHMGSKSISYFEARAAENFKLLYCSPCDAVEVENRFKELIETNRIICNYTIYSEAYKFQSEYYSRFMIIFIIIQTLIDMIVETPEYLIRRDVFDIRTCAYIFESQGVRFFPDIPLKYQVSLVKNLNKLIKFKSTDKCIVDICSIFGCESIEIFKYYILRDRKVTSIKEPKYFNEKNDDGEFDNYTNFDIKFVKVPLLDSYDDHIRTNKNIHEYSEIIDEYWNGDREYYDVLRDIKDMDFTVLKSKFYSVEAMIDITERMFQLIYFTNILMYNDIDKSMLLVDLPNISTKEKFELVDVFIVLYALTYIYYGAEDSIMDTQGKILKIKGFNLDADLEAIGEYLYENYEFTLKDLKVDGFTIPPEGKILTFKQLESLYTTNRDIYDHVWDQLVHCTDKKVYDAYKHIFESLFIMKLNMEYFSLPDGSLAPTYTEFLYYKQPLLATFLDNIKAIPSADRRQATVIDEIQAITTYLKDYIDQELINFDYIFSGLPSISMDFIKHYIEEVVDFFKSFKIFIHDMSLVYVFDDQLQNKVRMIDWILIKYYFEKGEIFKLEGWISKNLVDMTKKDKIMYLDKLWLDIDTWANKYFKEYYDEMYADNILKVIRDRKEYYSHFDVHDTDFEDRVFEEIYRMIVSLLFSEYFQDQTRDELYRWMLTLDKDEFYSEQMDDLIHRILVHVEYHQGQIPKDDIAFLTSKLFFNHRATYKGFESIDKESVDMELWDQTYRMLDNYYLIYTSDKE